jgi:hypothetical protein
MTLHSGQRVNQWTLIRRLGRGGNGEVWEASRAGVELRREQGLGSVAKIRRL